MNIAGVISLILALFVLTFAVRCFIFLLSAKKIIPKLEINRLLSASLSKIHIHHDLSHININFKHDDSSYAKPFVSILVASYNEYNVINRLMSSCAQLTYGRDNFEILVVDDSTDETFQELEKWQNAIPNLRIFHRLNRDGWKGGALNMIMQKMNKKSKYSLIVDADHVLEKDTLQKFMDCFTVSNNKLAVVQGFPISSIGSQENWISRGVYFRLVKRNLIEFVAKNDMELPMQITGSLFMIRSSVLKKVKFSHDLTEDWDLTLDLHLKHKGHDYKKIIFYPLAIAHCESPVKLYTYFKQRLRVSEGHTRGFKKQLSSLLKSSLPLWKKIELFFTGSQYAKFVLISALIVADLLRLVSDDILPIESSLFFASSVAVQAFSLSLYMMNNLVSTNLLGTHFNYKDAVYLVAINVCTFPAFVIGSLRGMLRQKGVFHKTDRMTKKV
ncbi:MAG: glycosyltransferase family 2 protein [Nitrosotalea sp.]